MGKVCSAASARLTSGRHPRRKSGSADRVVIRGGSPFPIEAVWDRANLLSSPLLVEASRGFRRRKSRERWYGIRERPCAQVTIKHDIELSVYSGTCRELWRLPCVVQEYAFSSQGSRSEVVRPWRGRTCGRCPTTKCSTRALITGACADSIERNCTFLRSQRKYSSESLKRVSMSPNSLEVGRCRFSADSDSTDR